MPTERTENLAAEVVEVTRPEAEVAVREVAVREVGIERLAGATRAADRDHVVVEAPLQLRARGLPVATIMRTPGHDLELVRGLLHAESITIETISSASVRTPVRMAIRTPIRTELVEGSDDRSPDASTSCVLSQVEADVVDIEVDAAAFAGRGLLSSAACGVCGRVAIADLEQRAREVTADTTIAASTLARCPDALRTAQSVFAATGGLHAAGLFAVGTGELVAAREDVGRHNAVDKLVGWALDAGIDPSRHALFLSGRLGYELVQKAIMFGVPIVGAVSAPSSLAIELAERFGVAIVGFVRGERANVYAHGWRIR